MQILILPKSTPSGVALGWEVNIFAFVVNMWCVRPFLFPLSVLSFTPARFFFYSFVIIIMCTCFALPHRPSLFPIFPFPLMLDRLFFFAFHSPSPIVLTAFLKMCDDSSLPLATCNNGFWCVFRYVCVVHIFVCLCGSFCPSPAPANKLLVCLLPISHVRWRLISPVATIVLFPYMLLLFSQEDFPPSSSDGEKYEILANRNRKHSTTQKSFTPRLAELFL
jgi:hypothetical protein